MHQVEGENSINSWKFLSLSRRLLISLMEPMCHTLNILQVIIGNCYESIVI
jgi:hypothetical protein